MNQTEQKARATDLVLGQLDVLNLAQITQVHLEAFPGSALTRLGAGAVHRYYQWQLTGPHECFATGAWRGGILIGFSVGGKFNGSLGGFLSNHKWYLMGRVLAKPWLVLHPWFFGRIVVALRSLLRRGGSSSRPLSKKNDSQLEPRKTFGILSIAVSPVAKRCGVGSLLMQRCEQQARQWGAQRMNLTVAIDNLEAIGFYERLGWQRVMDTGEWSGAMLKEF